MNVIFNIFNDMFDDFDDFDQTPNLSEIESNIDYIRTLPPELLCMVLEKSTGTERFHMMKTNTKKIWNALAYCDLIVYIPSKNIDEIIRILNTYGNYRYRYEEDGENYRKKILFSVDLSGTNVSDVSALSGVHTLNLSNTNVRDVSALSGVHNLNLSETKVTDVSDLGGVHILNLRGTRVRDVSALGGVHDLNLGGTSVTDVSALGRVHILNLFGTHVTDVSDLGGVHE